MNWDRIAGQWKQMTSEVKSKWAKLTDDDMTDVSAKKDNLVGKIQERYGIMRDEAERQVDEWLAKLSPRHGSDERANGDSYPPSHTGDARLPGDSYPPLRGSDERADSDSFVSRR